MNKKIKFVFFSLIVLFSLFLTGCRYNVFWEKEDLIIGETENYVISQNSEGEYYISGFTNKGLGAKTLTISKYIYIDNNGYMISYVDDIFKNHSYVRTLLIEIPTDKVNIKGCNSIRVIQVSQDNLVNPDSFFEGLKNIDIYITNSSYTYENEAFCEKNNVYYDVAPKISNFDCLTIYEYIALGVSALGVLLAAIAFYALFVFIKSEFLEGHNSISTIVCCGALAVYVIVTVVLTLIGYDNIIYLKGTIYLLPISFMISSIVAKENSENGDLSKLNIAFLIVSGIAVLVNLIFVESIMLIPAEILAIGILALLVAFIKFLYGKVDFLFAFFAIVTLLVAPASVFLCDLLLKFLLNNILGTIIGGVVLIITIVIIVIVVIRLVKNPSKERFEKSIPLPKFNGIFGCKIFLPYGFEWKGKVDVRYVNDNVYFSGEVISTKRCSSDAEMHAIQKEFEEKLVESIYSMFDIYYLEYPNAKRYSKFFINDIFVNYDNHK